MKKTTLYLTFGCAIAFTSCSQNDTPELFPDASDRKIVFHSSIPTLESRAAEIVTDLNYLHLIAFDQTDVKFRQDGKLKEYFEDVKIEKAADSQKFVSDQCVWPEPGLEEDLLHFFAYYPDLPDSAKLANKSVVDNDNITIGYKAEGYRVASDIARQVDFVAAYNTGTMDTHLYSGVDLRFRHQLSRIEVMAKGSHKSSDIEIAGVGFGQVVMKADFDFPASDADGSWSPVSKGDATYIFGQGDQIVTVGADPVSIMGAKIDAENENCAMLIPSKLSPWTFSTDAKNANRGFYLNVLLRVIDATPTAGKGEQRYPYTDSTQGLNSPNIPIVYLAVGSDAKTVSCQLYKDGDNYFLDEDCTEPYTLSADETVKEFGWAAVPVSADWQPGLTYTYTLDYTSGVGVHGPETPGDISPKAGDPIISDRVGVGLGVKDWTTGATAGVTVPGN